MIQVGDVVVSLDIFREKFLCDLDKCHGACCVEGDAGAPLELNEVTQIEKALPQIWDDLSLKARRVINKQGVSYVDEEGDMVTSIVNGKDCVFTCYDDKGCCFCALEKAYRAGKIMFCKPISCYLYPIRIKDFGKVKGINYNRWDICKSAVIKGEQANLPIYKFLKDPLVRKFGAEWYRELELTAEELKKAGYI
ncbi:MAG: DUF3109 family protein [Phocaeicola sp.]|uniref:DUF3109 family protein n=1 Tax=Phocaeicola TaxID=909656 RepID=UPI00234F8BE5|nr:DUF3109 family protein [Phocaeicola oris]MCE2616912.1 DUF3109 family protein [Phocaeicola oris]